MKRFKSVVLLTILLFAVCISISVFFFIRSQKIGKEKEELQISLQGLQKKIKNFRHENEIMMARLVLAEVRADKSDSGQEQNDFQSGNENNKLSAENFQEPNPSPPATASANPIDLTQAGRDSQTGRLQPTTKPEQEASDSPQHSPDSNLSVAVEGFNVSNQADNAIVQFRFKIKNTSPNSQKVSGHAIVVLKGDSLNEQKWMSIPAVRLVSGKPTGREKGYAFGISYFRNMRFKTNTPAMAQEYKQASVYVFSNTGELLLEQDFPVDLSPSRPSSSSPAANSKDAVPDAPIDYSR